MKKNYTKYILGMIIMIGFVLSFLFLSPSQTMEQRYPSLKLSECNGVKGNYFLDSDSADTEFEIHADDPHFAELIQLIQSIQLKKNLKNVFSQKPQIHTIAVGDFKWELLLHFDDATLSNGDHVSGEVFRLSNYFGDFSISFDGEQVWYIVNDQKEWLKKVMNLILASQ